MFNYLSFNKKTLLITPDKLKNKIREEIMSYKQLLDIKIMSISELKNRLFFEPLDITYVTLYKNFNKPLSIINNLIDYLYYIDLNQNYQSSKLSELKNIKEFLLKNNLIKLDKRFSQTLYQYQIKFIGFPLINKETQFIINKLEKLNLDIDILDYYQDYFFQKITHFFTIEDEINHVAYSIAKLLDNNIDINSIKLCNVQDNYLFYLKRIFKNYNIPLNLKSSTSLFNLPLSNTFINLLKEKDKEETINYLKDNYPDYLEYINQYINILNKYSFLKELDLSLIINDLKNTNIKQKKNTNSIEIVDVEEIGNSDNHIFVMSCNYNEFPKFKKDEDYLTDQEKEILNISTSKDINKNNIEKINKLIHSSKNIYLSYKDKSYFNEYHKVDYLKDVEEIEFNKDILESYSVNEDKIQLTKNLDNKKIDSNTLIMHSNYEIHYQEYSNKFKGISLETFNKALKNKKFNISYSNLTTFYQCPFRFYISNILNISTFKESVATLIGNIMHGVIENCYNFDFDFEKEFEYQKEKYINNVELKNSELFFIENIKDKTEEVVNYLLSREEYTSLNNHKHEEYVHFDKIFNNVNFTIKGYIDKLIYTEIDNIIYTAIIDLKSNNTKIDKSLFEFGLGLQLPFYVYLLRNDKRYKNSKILGLYIHNILNKENDSSSLKYNGLTVDNLENISILDHTYNSSLLIKSLGINKNGEFKYKNKMISEEYLNELYLLVDSKINEMLTNVLERNFSITQKILNTENKSCNYCEYSSICYKTLNDYIYLYKKEGDDNNGVD